MVLLRHGSGRTCRDDDTRREIEPGEGAIMTKSDRMLLEVWMLEVSVRMMRLAARCGR
jgi:hypothetical protein